MSKLSVVRQIKQQKNSVQDMNKEMEKELRWNNRFHLGKLPDYNVMKDKNYLSMKMLRDQIKTMDITTKKKMHPIREKIEIYSNLNIPFPYINTKTSEENKHPEAYNEELNLVQSMWDDLGVTEDYRQVFENIAKELDENLRRGFFEFEINSLKKFSDNLYKLSKDITARDKSISQLRHIDETLSNSYEKLNEKLLDEITQIIRNLRIQSINIIYHFNKIREISSYSIISGKFNLEKMNKIYLYDRNYLIQMRTDLDFLNSSNLAEYFEFSGQSDPFLLAISDDPNNQNKHKVPISSEMLNSIRECEFHLINDVIFFQMHAKRINRNLQISPITNKSPKLFKLNYPLAQPVMLNKSKLNTLLAVSKNRPSSSSYEFLKISEKSPEKYQKMFLTKTNENFLKSYRNKRIIIDNKIKIEREDYKSQENWKNSKTNQSKERAKSSRKEKKDFKLNKNEYDYLYSYNSVMLKPNKKSEFNPSEKPEKISNNNQIKTENQESIQTNKDKENHPLNLDEEKKNSLENLIQITEKKHNENIYEKLPSLNKKEIKKDSVKSKNSPNEDISYNDTKENNQNIREYVIKEEADEKISDEILENENDKKGSIIANDNINQNKVFYEQEKEESQFLVEEIVGVQQMKDKENSFENLKKSFGEKSQSYKSKEIKDIKENLISRISNKISEDNRDLEDDINYDLYVEEEEEIRQEKPNEHNKNILDDLKFDEIDKLMNEDKKDFGKEADSKYSKQEEDIQKFTSSEGKKSLKLIQQVEEKENIVLNEIKINNRLIVEEKNKTIEESHSKIENLKVNHNKSDLNIKVEYNNLTTEEKIDNPQIKAESELKSDKDISNIMIDQNKINQNNKNENVNESLVRKSSIKIMKENDQPKDLLNDVKEIEENKMNEANLQRNENKKEDDKFNIKQDIVQEEKRSQNKQENYIEQFVNSQKINLDNISNEHKEIKENISTNQANVIEVTEKQNEIVNHIEEIRKNSIKVPEHHFITKNDIVESNQEENSKNFIDDKLENNSRIKKEFKNIINESVHDDVKIILNQSIQKADNLNDNQTNRNQNNEIVSPKVKESQKETFIENEQINEKNISKDNVHIDTIQKEKTNLIKISKEENKDIEIPKQKIHDDEKFEEYLHMEIIRDKEDKFDPKIIHEDMIQKDLIKEEKLEDGNVKEEKILEENLLIDKIQKEKENDEGQNQKQETQQNNISIDKTHEMNVPPEEFKEESSNKEKISQKEYIDIEARNIEKIADENKDNQIHSPLQENNPESTISISFFTGDFENLQSIYPIFLLRVNEEQKVSFKIENDLNSYLTGLYPKILLAYKDNMIVGICCVSYDSSNDLNLRLNINHISTKLYDEFESISNEFKNFIIANIPCDEITIGIYYEMKNGNFEINTKIRDIFKNTLKFKWSKLENKSNNERIQILNLKCDNKDELVEAKKQKIKNFLNLDYFSVLKVEELKDKKDYEVDEIKKKNEQKINFFSLMFCLMELTKENFELENESFKKISINEIEKLTKNILNCSGSREEIQEFIQNNLGRNFISNLNHNLNCDLASNCIKSNLKFLNLLTSSIFLNEERYLYNRIYNPSIEILSQKENNREFYLIPSNDGINSLIISELSENLQSALNQSSQNISQFFSELYFKLENIPKEEKEINTIWLPCFSIKEGLSLPNPSCMSEIVIKKDGLDYGISHVDEFFYLSLNNDQNYISSPNLNPTQDDVVIKGKFMIAIINYELLSDINIPSIFVYIVEPTSWFKI